MKQKIQNEYISCGEKFKKLRELVKILKMSKNYQNEISGVGQNIRKLGAINLVILIILSFQLVEARDYDENSRDLYGVTFYRYLRIENIF